MDDILIQKILLIFLIIFILVFIYYIITHLTYKGSLKEMFKFKKNMYENYEDEMKYFAKKDAEISEEAIKIKAQAVKEGFDANKVYCKHCGSLIDKDSKFCKSCGKKL